jgi:hypothetical protein
MRATVIGRVADRSASRHILPLGNRRRMEQLARRPRWPWASLPAEVETSLLTALSDSGNNVRDLAADALGDVRTAAVIQAIETRLAAETSPVVRSALLAAKNKLDLAASR